jgi:hypothetical protein
MIGVLRHGEQYLMGPTFGASFGTSFGACFGIGIGADLREGRAVEPTSEHDLPSG